MSRTLSSHDTAIWHTIHIGELIDTGQLAQWPGEPAPFVMRQGPGERALATGSFVLYDYVAAGDGSYAHQSGMLLATGRNGLAMTAGFLAAQSVGNMARRKAAERAATEQWRPIAHGQLWVTEFGFHRASEYGMAAWEYGAVEAAQLVAPGRLWFAGNSTDGPISWVVESDWAELMLLLWVRSVGIQHPQTVGVGWLPPGWLERVQAAGIALPRVQSPSSPLRGYLPPV